MSVTMAGIIAGFVVRGYTPLVNDEDNHVDVTMLGIESGGGLTRTRGIEPRGGRVRSFSLSGIIDSEHPGTMPYCQTSHNGGFCIMYEFEGTRAFTEFELSTHIRLRAFRETRMTRTEGGFFFDSEVTVGWRANGYVEKIIPALVITRPPNIETIITSITGQRSVMDALNDGVTDLITEDTVFSAIMEYSDLMNTAINPNARQIMISIAIMNIL